MEDKDQSRGKIANRLYQYLEERINCTNVMSYMDKYRDDDGSSNLTIESVPVASRIIEYVDSVDTKSGTINKTTIDHTYDWYDFVSEANHTGFEYFPYIYGILDCHNGPHSKVYILYEMFDGALIELFNQITQPTEWYEILFQIVMIHYYISGVANQTYAKGSVNNHLYKKYKHPIKKQYTLGDYQFEIFHRNLIVGWDFELGTENQIPSSTSIDLIITYFKEHGDSLPVKPTGRLMHLLYDIQKSPKDIPKILNQYYNATAPPPKVSTPESPIEQSE